MYVCGVTVYDYCHIGHARTYVAFDMIYRYLKFKGYTVNYVRNITDIDDKIINRANESKVSPDDLANRFINIMHEDFGLLGLNPPDAEPKATETVDDIIKFIQDLISQEHAYVGTNGDIFFDVRGYTDYGHLAHQSLDSLEVGARVEKNIAKKDPLDFVLWKMAKNGEPAWDSPWGLGRPGWHIECSAMANKMLGDTLDIHGGGFDLKFPHHENERAQSEAKTGKRFVNYWMHAGFLQIDNEKMSKSLNNFLTIRDVLNIYPAELIRCFLVMSHYRSEIHYSDVSVKQTKGALDRLYNSLRDLDLVEFKIDELNTNSDIKKYCDVFITAMDDDFNAPDSFAVLFDIAKEINKQKEHNIKYAGELGFLLKTLGNVFGILQQDPIRYFQQEDMVAKHSNNSLSDSEIDGLIQQREQARLDKNYKKSDEIRNHLLAYNIVLEDSVKGTTWRRK
jgi:cysteinyl-tRNA synthetase